MRNLLALPLLTLAFAAATVATRSSPRPSVWPTFEIPASADTNLPDRISVHEQRRIFVSLSPSDDRIIDCPTTGRECIANALETLSY